MFVERSAIVVLGCDADAFFADALSKKVSLALFTLLGKLAVVGVCKSEFDLLSDGVRCRCK